MFKIKNLENWNKCSEFGIADHLTLKRLIKVSSFRQDPSTNKPLSRFLSLA